MRTKEAIFFNKLVHYNPKDFPNGMKNAIYKAMQEYAEEYHQSELLKLNKSDVSVPSQNLENKISLNLSLFKENARHFRKLI